MSPIIITVLFFLDLNYWTVSNREMRCQARGGIAVGRYKQTCLEADKKAEAVR